MRRTAPLVASYADVESAREGDLRSLKRLFECHAGLILRIVRSHLPSHPRPEMVAEEIWLAVWDSFGELDDALRWQPWLISTAHQWLESQYGDELLESDAEEYPQLDGLDPESLDAVHQRYFLGRSYDEIAQRMGSTRARVSWALRRAKANLRLRVGRSVRDHE